MPSSRGPSRHRDQTQVSHVSCTGRWAFTTNTTWEAPDKFTEASKSIPRAVYDPAQGGQLHLLEKTLYLGYRATQSSG